MAPTTTIRKAPGYYIQCLLAGVMLPLLCQAEVSAADTSVVIGEAVGESVAECITTAQVDASSSFKFDDSSSYEALLKQLPEQFVIGAIRIQRFNVFDTSDPRENNRLYRWANSYHQVTRESVIQSQLLFHTGDHVPHRLFEETERLLRDLPFIYDASIRPYRICGEVVDVEVITRDTWTFAPSISFSRSGGDSSTDFSVRETNFLGRGKQIELSRESDEDRTGSTILYRDPALFGTRYTSELFFSDNDDGDEQFVSLNRPFYALDTRWAWGASLENRELEEGLEFRSETVAEFNRELEVYSINAGFSAGVVDKKTKRWIFGFISEENEFSFSDSDTSPAVLPEDRKLVYPWVGYQSVEDKFREYHNLRNISRTEDVFIGESYDWRVGLSTTDLGATDNRLVVNGNYSNTLKADDVRFLNTTVDINGYWDFQENRVENLWFTAMAEYYRQQPGNWQFYSRLRFDYTDNLVEGRQLTLGGQNGLRGYESNYQVGDRSFVLSVEERYLTDWHWFNLVRVAGAVFLDTGRAWFPREDNGSNGNTLTNAGFGMRLISSRAQVNRVVHFDVALPLEKDDDVDDVQVSITVRSQL